VAKDSGKAAFLPLGQQGIQYLRGQKEPMAQDHIHPVFAQLLPRNDKESLLGQHGLCVWMTGLSGSGKSTLAVALERQLHDLGHHAVVLDGDNIRSGLNSNLGFSEEDRKENIRRIAEVAKLFTVTGTVTICCFVSPTEAVREEARTIIGRNDLVEVFVDTPLEECERRDVKGLYAKARAGEVREFTGISAPFEPPARPDIHIRATGRTVAECTTELLDLLLPRITLH
jgi:adenylylsulfate kinase